MPNLYIQLTESHLLFPRAPLSIPFCEGYAGIAFRPGHVISNRLRYHPLRLQNLSDGLIVYDANDVVVQNPRGVLQRSRWWSPPAMAKW